jgi:hypothetical protein
MLICRALDHGMFSPPSDNLRRPAKGSARRGVCVRRLRLQHVLRGSGGIRKKRDTDLTVLPALMNDADFSR